MDAFPIRDVVRRNFIAGVAARVFAHIKDNERSHQPRSWNLVHRPGAANIVRRRLNAREQLRVRTTGRRR